MNLADLSSREVFFDLLQSLTAALWLRAERTAELIPPQANDEDNIRQLFLRALSSIHENDTLAKNLVLLAEQRTSAALVLSLAGASLSLCSQFLCINQVDEARREALAFVQHAIAAAHSIGLIVTDTEREMLLERAGFMPARIESQQCLSLASKLGQIPRRMLFVLGMHRSGTSALAGMLREIGLDEPIDLLPPTKDNPKGYFESVGILAENERLLAALGTSWRLEKPLPHGWIDQKIALEWRQALIRRLNESFGEADFPVVKDPRFCVLLAGLSCWLHSDVIDFQFVLLIRHPHEVVNSLLARSNDPITKVASLQLWIESVLSSERNTRGMQRVVVMADDLFEFPARVVTDLQRFIESDDFRAEVEGSSAFVDPDLRHHHHASSNRLRQPALGVSRCDLLEELAIKIYDEFKSHPATLPSDRLDALNILWTLIA